ncbi:MAG: hypothetical protein ABIJ18_04135 [archaeon]
MKNEERPHYCSACDLYAISERCFLYSVEQADPLIAREITSITIEQRCDVVKAQIKRQINLRGICLGNNPDGSLEWL